MPSEPTATAKAKSRQRDRCLAQRRSLAADRVLAASRAVTASLLTLPAFAQATYIHTYVGNLNHEIDTRAFIKTTLAAGKRLVVPVVEPKNPRLGHVLLRTFEELQEGHWGLLQPVDAPPFDDLDRLDLIVVPGIAFDRRGHRIGYGGGYYDRFLSGFGARASARPYTVGLTYSELLFDALPVQAYDRAVDAVLTDTGLTVVRPFIFPKED